MVDELQPPVLGAEDRQRGFVFGAADGHDVVTGAEPAERVPLGGLRGYRAGRPANTVTTVEPGWASSRCPAPIAASSKCGENTSRRSKVPAGRTPQVSP